jgi:hypothetical protein
MTPAEAEARINEAHRRIREANASAQRSSRQSMWMTVVAVVCSIIAVGINVSRWMGWL